jgi:hypothetical protein
MLLEEMSTKFKNKIIGSIMDDKGMKYIGGIVKEEYAKKKKIAPQATEVINLIAKEYDVFLRLACKQTGIPFTKNSLAR